MEVGQVVRVVLLPVPDRERGVAAPLVTERAVEERSRCVPGRRLEEEWDEDDRRGDDKRNQEHDPRPDSPRIGIAGPERQQQQWRELRPRSERSKYAAGTIRRREVEAPDEQRRLDRVVRVRVRDVLRERPGRPSEGERRPESRPPETQPDES